MRKKLRKNFLPTLILAIFCWIIFGWILFKIPPTTNLAFFAFYASIFFAVFLTFALIFANSRRGALMALFLILFLILCYHQLGNFLNIILLGGIILSLEFYLTKR